MFQKKKVLVETNDLILTKKFWGLNRIKLIDKNDKHKFKVIAWFACNSLGTVAGYSVWCNTIPTPEVNYGKELTPRRYNPKTEKDLIEFVKGINYEQLQ